MPIPTNIAARIKATIHPDCVLPVACWFSDKPLPAAAPTTNPRLTLMMTLLVVLVDVGVVVLVVVGSVVVVAGTVVATVVGTVVARVVGTVVATVVGTVVGTEVTAVVAGLATVVVTAAIARPPPAPVSIIALNIRKKVAAQSTEHGPRAHFILFASW